MQYWTDRLLKLGQYEYPALKYLMCWLGHNQNNEGYYPVLEYTCSDYQQQSIQSLVYCTFQYSG